MQMLGGVGLFSSRTGGGGGGGGGGVCGYVPLNRVLVSRSSVLINVYNFTI